MKVVICLWTESAISHGWISFSQKFLFFHPDIRCHIIAVQDGNLRVFKWPSWEITINEASAHTTVKDLHFRFNGMHLEFYLKFARYFYIFPPFCVKKLCLLSCSVFLQL